MYFLKTTYLTNGRIISLDSAGKIYVGKNYNLFAYNTNLKPTPVGKIPCSFKRKMIEPSRLLCRAFRHEIRGFTILPDGDKVCATRQGLFYSEPDGNIFKPASLPKTHLEIKFPMTITTDSAGRVLWGEYWGNPDRRQLRLFVSEDKGKSYEPFWQFERGEVRHVHNIIEDRYDNCYWVFVGDHGKEPGIARLSKDLKSLDWLVKGEQKYRAVSGFIFEDKIIYGTDTEKEYNSICAIDKKSGKLEKLCDTPGSSIYSAKFGKWYVISTSVEYFANYKNKMATLWLSKNAYDWQQVYQAEKDMWNIKYFQFGSIILPRIGWNNDILVFSGQAIKKIDNKVYTADIFED